MLFGFCYLTADTLTHCVTALLFNLACHPLHTQSNMFPIRLGRGTAWAPFSIKHIVSSACICTQRPIIVQVCHFPPALQHRTTSPVSALCSAFTSTHKTHTCTSNNVCIFELFNLDGMFHLQAAITAGCLIVWVRLMGMCVRFCVCVLICMRFQFSQFCCTHFFFLPATLCLSGRKQTHS